MDRRWIGQLINIRRDIQRVGRNVSARIRSASWQTKLLLVSIVCGLLSILGLYSVDHAQKEIQKTERNRQQRDRLEEAARTWAIQRTLLELSDSKPLGQAERTDKELRLLRSQFEDKARRALNIQEASPASLSRNIFEYAVDDGTRLKGALMSLLGRGSMALLVISILLALAVVVAPAVKNLMETAEKRLEQGSEIPGEIGKPAGSGVTPVPVPMSIGRAQATEAINPAGGSSAGSSGSPVVSLMPTIAAAGALIAIGTIFINVAGRDVSLMPEISSVPRVGLDINDFSVAVQPGRVDIPAAQIVSTDTPDIKTSVPPLEFHFPLARIEQQALTALTQELTEYRQTMQRLTMQDQKLSDLQLKVDQQFQTIAQLQSDKNSLQTQLEIRPTREQVDQVMATIEKQSQLNSLMETRLNSLVDVGTKQLYGDRLAARQYTRKLLAQNQGLLNRLFRRGLIQENCRTFAEVKNDFPSLPEIPGCSDPLGKSVPLSLPEVGRTP